MAIQLRIDLLSDTTFSRGDGTAGEVDVEVAHDEFGCPYIPGKTLKGLLRDAWLQMAAAFPEDAAVAEQVLGPSADLEPGGSGQLRIDTAMLPPEVLDWIRFAVTRDDSPVHPHAVLAAVTDVRKQTARDKTTGGPLDSTLRSSRVILRGQWFLARLSATGFTEAHWRVLARSCLNVRHAGSGRNRGLGHVRLSLVEDGRDATRSLAQL